MNATMDSHTTNTPLKRTRAKRSCDFCRKRKARCDADHTVPCSNCKAWGFNCEFLTVRKKRGPPSVYVENLETRCKKMESLLTCLTKTSIKDIERNDFRPENYVKDYQHSNYNIMDNDHSSIEDEEEDDDDDSSDYSHSQRNTSITETMNMDETLANLKLDDYDSIKYTGHSAGLQLLDEKLFKSKNYVQWPGREDVALQLMSQNELLVVRTSSSNTNRIDVGFSLSSTIFDDKTTTNTIIQHKSKDVPSHLMIEKAIKLYFSHIHTFLPIINRARFETHDMKSPTNNNTNVLLQAVLAVSFRFASRHFPKLYNNKKPILYADFYFKKVMLCLRDSYRARLRHVQAALLMTLYLDMDENDDVESMQWYTLGKAIRMAQDIGLHRSCSDWNLPKSEIETRHRVFYACYILDRLMGARAGKPLTILDRDFDTDLPVPYEVVDDDQKEGPSIYHSFISLIKLCEILGRILKALYAPKSKHSNSNAGLDDPTILAVFDRRLKNWKATLDDVNISQAQKVNLLLFYHTVMLLLHRPFIEFNTDKNIIHGSIDLNTLAANSRQACENAASNISVIVRQKQSLMSDPDSYSPLCLPTCFVYSMFQSSLIHLAIVIKNRDSLRRLRLLQRSIALLKQHQSLSSGQRAHNILLMLVSINGINLDNLLENDHLKEEDTPSVLTEDGLPHSPIMKNRNELQFSSRPPQQQQIQTTTMIPSCEDNMPKSSWYQRMMNTSIVGGITPDLHQQGISENNSSSQALEQLLPYSHTTMESSHLGHNRSDSNATLYHHSENGIPPPSNYPQDTTYYNINSSTKRMDIYNDNRQTTHLFEEAGGNMRILQSNHPSSTPFTHATSAPTLLSHQHNSTQQLFHHQRNSSLGSTPQPPPLNFNPTSFHSTATPHSLHSTTNNNNTSSAPNNNYPMNYLPPSNLNWGDWGVYLDQPQPNTTSPEHHHLPIHR